MTREGLRLSISNQQFFTSKTCAVFGAFLELTNLVLYMKEALNCPNMIHS